MATSDPDAGNESGIQLGQGSSRAALASPGFLRDLIASFLLTAFVVLADFATGVKMSFSLFYIAPVAFIAWRQGLIPGLSMALFCVLSRFFADMIGGRHYDSTLVPIWNTGMRTGILVLAAVAMSRIRTEVFAARKAREEALAASTAKSDFLRNMSHEIRTPLNALLAMAELLSESRLDAEQAGFVKVFKKEGQNLLKLINDLLDDAKIEAGKLAVEKIPFSLTEIVAEVASETGSQARQKGLDFSVLFSPALPDLVVGDPWLMKRTLMNLAGNALKFTSTGRISIRAERTFRDSRMAVKLSVSDSGIGIPSDRLESIFAPFNQAESSTRRRFGGTGLGLSLCKRFVELMGGSIEVESIPGEGSVFSFSVPLEIPAESPSPESTAPEEDRPITLSALKILVVDDYAVNRQIVRAFLKDTPCIVEEAIDGPTGIEKIKEAEWDLILMDIQMPGLDGYEAAKAIRKWEGDAGRARVPMVALTAHAGAADREAARAAGFDAHLAKPFAKKQLLSVIKSAAVERQEPETAPIAKDLGPNRELSPEIAELLPQFLTDMKRLCATARGPDAPSNLEELASIGHKIRGAGGSFGFDRLSELGGRLEETASSGEATAAEIALREIESFLKEAEHGGS